MHILKPSILGTLRLIAILTLVLPAIIFTYSTWQNRKDIEALANERIERALDVLQEHALKSLQTVEGAISEANEVLSGMSVEQIRAAESDIFLRLKRTQQALPQIEAIWAFDAEGRPLVSSTILPVPPALNNSERSYFRVHREGRLATYVSEVVRAKIGSLRFFVVSAPRQPTSAGDFNGVIAITVMPEHFVEFYRKLARGDDVFVLARPDGTLLARFPQAGNIDAASTSALPAHVAQSQNAGIYTAVSKVDGVERRVGYRKVPGLDLYVLSGIATSAIRADFWSTLFTQFALGLPAVLTMFLLTLFALYRVKRFEVEVARREAAEAALKQAQRLEAIGQLTGGVAHDFNNLLMVVGGNLQRLRKQIREEGTSRAFDAIEMAVKRGSDLTRQLLSFSRRQTHEAKVVEFQKILPSVRDMLRSSLRSDIAIETHVAPDSWRSKLDPSEFELALLNLAVNARDAMPAGGRFTVSAQNAVISADDGIGIEGDFVAVSAEDTGLGILPEMLPRVFEPFFTTKDVGKGTGLGLSQVYGFARQAGGTATVESEVGRGTRVTLYLPRSNEMPDAGPDKPLPKQSSKERTEGRILIVEDNVEVADVTQALLEDIGYQVVSAANVAEALHVLRSAGPFDAVLTDIVMPGGANGVDLAHIIHEEYGHKLPVILATGFSEHAQAATDEGFIVLRKPYDASELSDALAATKRGRSLNKPSDAA